MSDSSLYALGILLHEVLHGMGLPFFGVVCLAQSPHDCYQTRLYQERRASGESWGWEVVLPSLCHHKWFPRQSCRHQYHHWLGHKQGLTASVGWSEREKGKHLLKEHHTSLGKVTIWPWKDFCLGQNSHKSLIHTHAIYAKRKSKKSGSVIRQRCLASS